MYNRNSTDILYIYWYKPNTIKNGAYVYFQKIDFYPVALYYDWELIRTGHAIR
jgi:hypothetical protein